MLLAIAAVLCAAAFAPAAASAAPTGSIAGTVIGADTQEGIEAVEVCASGVEAEGEEDEWFSCEATAPDGTYVIEEVPAGEYTIEFGADGTTYATEFYPHQVIVGEDAVTGIDIELSHPATIEGTAIRDADEAPVEELEVCAWSTDGEESSGCTETEPDGTYELMVPPGEWIVEFSPETSGQNLTFQYFDQRDRWSEADFVLVEEWETAAGIDARLGPGATISGRVTSTLGSGLAGILVCAIDTLTDDLANCTETDASGEYEVNFLPASRYKVAFSLDRNEWFGSESFDDADAFPTQFWDGQATLAAATVISVATGQEVSGVDARLGSPPSSGEDEPSLTVNVPPAAVAVSASASVHSPAPRRKTCRKGLKRKKVKGKVRCVKPKKHGHRHGQRGGAA